MDLVDDVDFFAQEGRWVVDFGENFLADVVDARVGGRVDFDVVERGFLVDGLDFGVVGEWVAVVVELVGVDGFGEEAGERSFPGAARSEKKVVVVFVGGLLDFCAEDGDDVVLPDDVVEGFGAVFVGERHQKFWLKSCGKFQKNRGNFGNSRAKIEGKFWGNGEGKFRGKKT